MDIAFRWAMRWLVRHKGLVMPENAALACLFDRIVIAYNAVEDHLHYQWAQANARACVDWRQEVRNLRRNPRRLQEFAANESLAQMLRYGAARLNAPDDLEVLIRQMEADPPFFRRVISAAMEQDIADKKKRFLYDPGGRPKDLDCYYPIVHAAADVFYDVTGEPLGRSTSSATLSETRSSGKAIGPGIQFLKRLLAPFPRRFSDESISHLIRDAV